MLFLPESIYERRHVLLRDLESVSDLPESAWRQLLELDPEDHVAELELGDRLRERGDDAGAEACYWRAVEAQPRFWRGYALLSEMHGLAGEEALSHGLAELAIRKLPFDEEAVDKLNSKTRKLRLPLPKSFNELSLAGRLEVIAEAMRIACDREPADVAARLQPHRLVQKLLDAGDLGRELVDEFLEAGSAVARLLVGVLRAWARDFMPEEDTEPVENALALLGEVGGVEELPALLEFAALEDSDLHGVAALETPLAPHSPPPAGNVRGLVLLA